MRWGVGEQAECSAGILGMGQTKDPWDDLDVCVQSDVSGDRPFGPAIEQDDDGSENKMCGAREVSGHSEIEWH